MFDKIRDFLRSVAGENERQAAFTRDDPRVAMAALFYHVIEADGVVSPGEEEALSATLKDAFDLDEQELRALLKAGQMADDEAVDLYRFTSVLKNAFDAEQRIAFIELLWQLVYADGVRDELEDNIVWRVAELIGVSGRDRVLMRQRVAKRADRREGDDES
ncbi:MAG TPA: TerB family tellurite resistance protein [Pararhizobium sp.]|nr:TerB family tellurite resistance protein [Pararhizobium sp.]